MRASLRRIGAVVLRHVYLFRTSWLRILDSIYWPAVQMVMWGFLTQFLSSQTNYVAQAFGVLASAPGIHSAAVERLADRARLLGVTP